MIDRASIWRLRSKRPTLLFLLVLACLLSLLTYQLWFGYRDQIRSAETNARNLVTLFDSRLEATLRHTDANLLGLIQAMPIAAMNPLATHLYEQEVNASLDARLLNVEGLAGYRIYDANGDSLYTTDSASVPHVNIADRPYFQLLRDAPEAGLVFSDVLIGRTTGRPTVVMARAMRDRQGRFLGVVCGLLDMAYYQKQFAALDLGQHGLVALKRSDSNALLIAWPSSATQAFDSDYPIAARLIAGDKSFVLNHRSTQDSVERVVGVHALAHYPFYFMVGLGRGDVLADWRLQAWFTSATALLLLLFVSFFVARLGRMRIRETGILDSLAISELQFDSLAQRLPVGISRLDAEGRYTYVNNRLVTMTGFHRDRFLGSDWTDFFHPDDRLRLQSLDFVGERPPPLQFECRFIRPDGQTVHVAGEVQPEANPDGRILGYTVAQIDISDRKHVEAELRVAKQQAETANMAKTRFLATASHDLRQPIQAINLFRDALERTELSQEQKTITRFLSLSVHSLGDLLYSLLDISKLDAGLIKPQMKEVLVESLFQTLDADFSPLARERNLRFKLFYPLKDMILLTDPILLRSVLRNLVDNAFKYTEQGGVLVGVRKRGGRAVIQVWDTGIGIDARYGGQIFDECFQVGNHLRDRAKGLGIGLSIARRLSRLLKGEVTFHSRPGVGSVFEVELPLIDTEHQGVSILATQTTAVGAFDEFDQRHVSSEKPVFEANAEGQEADYSRLAGWQIVVVEDDPVVAKSIEISLQTFGMRVQVFHDAELALAWPELMAADFYISDLVLPGQNGLQLLDAVQQRDTAPIDAVLMTGETAPGRVEHIKAASRWPVLIKPADLSRLLDIMDAVAKKREC